MREALLSAAKAKPVMMLRWQIIRRETVVGEDRLMDSKTMKCPYCGNEMELGLIQSPHKLSWIKGKEKRTFPVARFHKGSVVLCALKPKTFASGCAVEAFLCRSCKKVIIDY